MKKYLIIFVLIFTLSSSCFAFAPLVIPAWYYVAGAALTVAGATGVQYAMRPNVPASVSSNGDITRSTAAGYAVMVGSLLTVKEVNLTTMIPASKIAEIANNNIAAHPLINAALIEQTNAPFTAAQLSSSGSVPSGSYVETLFGGTAAIAHTTGSSVLSNTDFGDNAGGKSVLSNGTLQTYKLVSDYHRYGSEWKTYHQYLTSAVVSSAPAPVYAPATPSQFAGNISASGVEGTVKPLYDSEIDAMLQNPDYVPTFTDATTGLPWSPPADVLNPDKVAAYNSTGTAAAAAVTAATTAAAASTAAAAAATTAQSASTTATALANANPNDATLAAAAARAAAVAATAAATAATAAATAASTAATAAATQAETDTAKADKPSPAPQKPSRKSISLEPFKALIGVMAATYPFNLPTAVNSYFQAFTTGGSSAPVFDLPLPMGQTIHCDLSFFDPVATIIRYMVGMLITAGMMFYIFHFFRGIS